MEFRSCLVISIIFDKLFTYPQWFIGYRDRKSFDTPFDTDEFKIIDPPPGRFYADPFVIKHKGRNYIFFEDFCFIKGTGAISFIEIDGDGNHTEPVVVLQKKSHLSYPFLFEWSNQIFMIPETGDSDSIELYSTINFPYDWKLEKVLMKDVKAYDTTIWFSDQKTWMFTNIVEPGRPQFTDLYLFYADTIFDDWKAHPKNPIISDINSARPAGNLFMDKGEIIRPGQNSFVRYGQALVFNKITCFTESNYSELKIEQVNPSWYAGNLCCHTYNFNEDLEVIDGLLIKKDILNPCRKVASHFYKKFDK